MIDNSSMFTNAEKASSKPLEPVGIYVGQVVRIDENGNIYVTIPKVSHGTVFGPVLCFSVVPTVGNFVAVSFLDSRMDEAVILGIKDYELPPPEAVTTVTVLETQVFS